MNEWMNEQSVFVCVCARACACVCARARVCVLKRERHRKKVREWVCEEWVNEWVSEWVSEMLVELCCCLFEGQKNVKIATVNIIYINTNYLNFVCKNLLLVLLIIFISAAVERRWKFSNPIKCVEELYI
jgi:hypothetical protein